MPAHCPQRSSGTQSIVGSAPILTGFETLRSLDTSLLGSRMRMRHQASAKSRGLVVNPVLLHQPGVSEKLQTQVHSPLKLITQYFISHQPTEYDGHTVAFTQDAEL